MTPLVVSGHEITMAVCEALDITPKTLMEGRAHRVTTARHMVWYLCRQLTEMSYSELGRYFGRDHTTIYRGVESFEIRLKWDEKLNKKALTVMAYLKERDNGNR